MLSMKRIISVRRCRSTIEVGSMCRPETNSPPFDQGDSEWYYWVGRSDRAIVGVVRYIRFCVAAPATEECSARDG